MKKLKKSIHYWVNYFGDVPGGSCELVMDAVLEDLGFRSLKNTPGHLSGKMKFCAKHGVDLGNDYNRALELANNSDGSYVVLAMLLNWKTNTYHVAFIVPGKRRGRNKIPCAGGGFDMRGIQNGWYYSDTSIHFSFFKGPTNASWLRFYRYGVKNETT